MGSHIKRSRHLIRREIFTPFKGFQITINGKSIVFSSSIRTKEYSKLSDEQIISTIKALNNYSYYVNNQNPPVHDDIILSVESFKSDQFEFLYKYMPQKIYMNHIRKGQFMLGSIKLYHKIESLGQDYREGYANIIFRSPRRDFISVVTAGYNYYIMSCTSISENCGDKTKYMQNRFGDTILRINNPKSFAGAFCKAIGAVNYDIQRINYSSLKAFQINLEDNELDNLSGSPFSDRLHRVILEYAKFPCLHVKPSDYCDEEEIRIVFQLPKDSRKRLYPHCKGLLDFIEVMN